MGVTSFFQGEFVRAHGQLEQAIAHYDRANSPVRIARYAQGSEGRLPLSPRTCPAVFGLP
jgi:hypothetical protein